MNAIDRQSTFFQKLGPLRTGEGTSIDMNRTRQVFANLRMQFFVDVVRLDSKLMDRIAASRCQQPHGLGNDSFLGLLPLHGQHRFTNNNIGRPRLQSGVGGISVNHRPPCADQLAHVFGSNRVLVDPGVRGRACSKNFRCGTSKPRSELNNACAGQARIGKHLEGQFQPSGTQNAFADASEYPVSGSV